MVLATIRRHDRRFLPGLSSPPSPAASPSFFNDAALPSAPSRPLFLLLLFPPPFLPSSERRQVGVRAAVNSPAPLSALMSLLLFALLNAIRAYSVSLPPLLGAPRYHVVLSTSPRERGGSRTDALSHARAHARPRGPRSLPRLFRAHAAPQQVHVHARNTDVRVTRGIAPRGRRGHSNQPQTCIRTLLCNF